ncbi:hypothetical protein ACFPYJ_21380 [Paenibacillus solisilvae]|uniref:Secreted protein n=1 Tax=Paenibacillus solisilvae TaxID=2486751 RepID=A0ABW0W0G8_9BACL
MRIRTGIWLAFLCVSISVCSGCMKESSRTWSEENESHNSVLSTVYPAARSVLGEVYGSTETDHTLTPAPNRKSAMDDNRPQLQDEKDK